jgi:hypothetical protein
LPRSIHRFAAIATTLAALGACAPVASAADAGTIRLARGAESSFDAYTKAPTLAQQTWMRAHYWRMRVYSPYFDSRLAWYRDGWVYQDAYAIYPDSPVLTSHPDWILRDPTGNKLWIQFACGGGRCTQYAADIGNPAFRAWWIAAAKAKLAAGYRGLFIDDVNMAQRVSDGYGVYTQPLDPRPGARMDERAWQHYMADFMTDVRAALPGVEIVHNAIWTVGDATADLKRQLAAANYIELERGFNDAGIVGGSSKFGWQTLASFIDRRHAAGQAVLLDGNADASAGRLYGLATYLLLNAGNDAIANDAASRPDAFWKGFDVNLGPARGARYSVGGVWRRDFAGGVVLVNEPGAPPRTVTVGAGLRDLDGVARTSVTLGPASGAVLLGGGGKTATTVDTGRPSLPRPAAPAAPVRRAVTTRRTVSTRPRVRGVKVHGRVRGATAGTVRLVVQKRCHHRWRTVRRAQASVSGHGRYHRRVARLQRGRYRVRASYLGTAAAGPSRSGYHRFRIRTRR